MDQHFVVRIVRDRYAQFFAEGGYDGIDIGEPDVAITFAAGKPLKDAGDGSLFFGFSSFFFQYQVQPPEEVEIPVGRLHERAGALRVEIRRDHAVFAINAFAPLIRLDLGVALLSRGKDVTAQRVKTTDERAVRMDAATLGVEEDTGAVLVPVQNSSAIVGVMLNEIGSGQAPIRGQTCNFVGIDLDFLMAAATKTLTARKEKGCLPAKSCSAQW